MILAAAVLTQLQTRGDEPAIKVRNLGLWTTVSWSALVSGAARLAASIDANQVRGGQVVPIIARNSPDWIMAEIAVLALGGIPAVVRSVQEMHGMRRDTAALPDGVEASRLAVIATGNSNDDSRLEEELLGSELPCVVASSELLGGSHDDRSLPSDFLALLDGAARSSDSSPQALIRSAGTDALPHWVLVTPEMIQTTWAAFSDGMVSTRDRIVRPREYEYWVPRLAMLVACTSYGAVLHFSEDQTLDDRTIREVAPTMWIESERGWDAAASRLRDRMQSAWPARILIPSRSGLRPQPDGTSGPRRRLAQVRRRIEHGILVRPIRQQLGFAHLRTGLVYARPPAQRASGLWQRLGVGLIEIYAPAESGGVVAFRKVNEEDSYHTLLADPAWQAALEAAGDTAAYDDQGRVIAIQRRERSSGLGGQLAKLETELEKDPLIAGAIAWDDGTGILLLVEVDLNVARSLTRSAGLLLGSDLEVIECDVVTKAVHTVVASAASATCGDRSVSDLRLVTLLESDLLSESGSPIRPLIRARYGGLPAAAGSPLS